MEGMRRFIILNFSACCVSLKKGRLKSDDPLWVSIAKIHFFNGRVFLTGLRVLNRPQVSPMQGVGGRGIRICLLSFFPASTFRFPVA